MKPARKFKAGCVHCNGEREIASPKLGKVRCPYCRPARVNRVPARELRRMLTAADVRSARRAEAASTVSLAEFKLPGVPEHLVTTNRVLERWGEDGSGLASDLVDNYRIAKAPPLDPGTYTVVEKIINAAPRRIRVFAYAWWRSSNPAYIATHGRAKPSRRQLGRIRIDALNLFKAAFLASKYADLVALVRFIPE